MIKLISFTICPFVQRIAALLEGAGVAYDTEFISLSDKPDWFLEISPHGQVPVLVTEEGEALFESDAISDYVFDRYMASTYPHSLEHKANEKAWSILAVKNYLPQCGTMSSKDSLSFDEKFAKLRVAFNKMNTALANQKVDNSNDISLLSSAWIVLLHRADIVQRETDFDMLEGLTDLQEWQKRLLAQSWAQKSVAANFEEKFIDFYLNDERYLRHQCIIPENDSCAPSNAQSCCG